MFYSQKIIAKVNLGKHFWSQKPIFKAMRLIREQRLVTFLDSNRHGLTFDPNQDLELSFHSSEELRKIKFEDYCVGTAALSSCHIFFLLI